MTAADTVRSLYDAFARKDADALRAVLHPEVEWIQCAGFPGGGHRRSADEVVEKVMGGLNTEWEGFGAPVEEYIDAGDRVVALGHYEGTHTETRRPMNAVFAHVYDVSDGRIVRFRQYTDTWPIVAAIRGEDVS